MSFRKIINDVTRRMNSYRYIKLNYGIIIDTELYTDVNAVKEKETDKDVDEKNKILDSNGATSNINEEVDHQQGIWN